MTSPFRFEPCPHDGGAKSEWRMRDGYRACTYCGSMHPEDLFKAVEAGTCQISGTDKNYKIYVDVPNPGAGQPCVRSSANFQFNSKAIKVTLENIDTLPLRDYQRMDWRKDLERGADREHWVVVEPDGPKTHAKFYYAHFDGDQQQKFLDLYNAKKLPLEPQFGLYVLPYFARRGAPPATDGV